MQLLFWPFMILSIGLAIIAIVVKKPLFLVIASVLILPLSLYLAATPLFEWCGLVFPLLYLGAAYSLAKKILWLTILLTVPNFLVIGWLAFMVLTQ